MKKIRVILFQKPLGIPLVKRDIKEMIDFGPDFICFPEYFFVLQRLGNQGQTLHNQRLQLRRISLLSQIADATVIGGTMPELYGGTVHNTSFVFDRGAFLGSYRKINLYLKEIGTITPGNRYRVFHARGITFGVMICADIFDDKGFQFMKEHGVQIIFSPTFSLKKIETPEEKFKRDRDIYVRGANLSNAVIVKVCGVQSEYKNFIQARSLIASKEGVLFRVMPEEEDTAMIIKQEIVV